MSQISSDMYDANGDQLLLGDKVLLLTGDTGEIVFECGAYGFATLEGIDYGKIQSKMDATAICCENKYLGCMNDNFISLWELYWNFNCEDNSLYPVLKIKVKDY